MRRLSELSKLGFSIAKFKVENFDDNGKFGL